jgi:hypothetical protein
MVANRNNETILSELRFYAAQIFKTEKMSPARLENPNDFVMAHLVLRQLVREASGYEPRARRFA